YRASWDSLPPLPGAPVRTDPQARFFYKLAPGWPTECEVRARAPEFLDQPSVAFEREEATSPSLSILPPRQGSSDRAAAPRHGWNRGSDRPERPHECTLPPLPVECPPSLPPARHRLSHRPP